TDEPSATDEMVEVIKKLAAVGCNILQSRPNDKKPLPQLWTNPITGQPLSPPKGPDERSLLAKHDPELLHWFDELEKHPYKTVMQHRDAEADRHALASVPYDAETHATNVFRSNNKTAQDAFVKRDPALAAFYRAEAAEVSLPLFGNNRNQTITGKLAKD